VTCATLTASPLLCSQMRISSSRFSPPLVIAVIALAVGLSAIGYALSINAPLSNASNGTVEVTATGTVTARPDTLTVDFSVTTKATTSRAALTKNNAETHTLDASLMGSGVPASDLQTTGLSVTQSVDSNDRPNGYVAEDDVTATLHNLQKAGHVIDSAESNVGNDLSITDTTYSIAHLTGFESAARGDAMRNALSKARGLADGVSESVGRVVRITETEQPSSPPPVTFGAARAAGNTSQSSVPLRPGTQTVVVNVDVVFALAG
jgi:uncharacterized protein YggE